jgi:cytidyltransferase-like protein
MITVCVSGYFTPLHNGHTEYFRMASYLGDRLVVIVNNDYQCFLKHGYVFMPEKDRAELVGSIRWVDGVYLSIDQDGSVCRSLEAVHPNVFAKGGDRVANNCPEYDLCLELGIKFVDRVVPVINSSSDFIKEAVKNYVRLHGVPYDSVRP